MVIKLDQFDECFPTKTIKVTTDDQPFFTPELKVLDRKRKKEFWRNRKSSKWRKLHKEYQRKVKKAKSSYYNNIVKDLKLSKPGEWYSKLKRMGCYDQVKFETVMLNLFQP